MGLGKTVQSLAAVELLARAAGVERVLVVTLTSTKHQWKHEIQKFTDRSARVVAGSQQARISQLDSDEFYKITSYDLLRADLDAVHRFSPDLVILDEAQRIKNWKTRTAQIVKRLQSQYAIVLTGTPIENRLEELHSILEFVDRYRLGPLFRFLHEHQITDNAGKVIGYEKLDQIATTLKPVMLRRTRDEVLKQLPSRIDSTHFVPMTPQQQTLHDSFKEVVAKLVFKWRKHRFLSEADQKRMQAALQSMRMAANSTYLIDPETQHGSKPDELVNKLLEILEDPRQKVVVFSQWVRSHELIMKRLDRLDIGYAFLHGGIPGDKRDPIIQRFYSDPNCRVFLSTDAGGIGLNLQFASSVLIMDQPWNPALLEQRIARVHRLGQKQPVSVLHFVSQGSIEEGILSLQSFKRSLFAGILDGGADTIHLGGSKLQQFVNSIEKATSAIGDPLIVESTHELQTHDDPQPTQQPNPSTNEHADDPWQSLIQQGQRLLSALGHAFAQQTPNITPPPTDPPSTQNPSTPQLEFARDPAGRPRLSVTLPSDAALQQFAHALANLARCFAKPD
jgi:SNF2 family DNA or RNA helicase